MKKIRDSQKSDFYAAEHVLRHVSKPLAEVKDIERYLKKQMKRKFLISRYGAAVTYPMKVGNGAGQRRALGSPGWIGIPLWARTESIVLHEWAHSIHGRIGERGGWFYNSSYVHCKGSRIPEVCGGAGHGWQYAAIFLDVVHACMGAEAAKTLKASYKACRIRFRKPVKRNSPGNPAALAAWREARQAACSPS
jgi:hypothetical protein